MEDIIVRYLNARSSTSDRAEDPKGKEVIGFLKIRNLKITPTTKDFRSKR